MVTRIIFSVFLIFILFTGCSCPAQKAQGYRGIWFSLTQFYPPGKNGEAYGPRQSEPVFPYGDKYSGGLGTYTMKHVPIAVYAPEVDRTFFVYGGTTAPDERHLLCMASWYDHATHTVPRPTIVHDKEGVDDPHDNPSIALDENGHVWVFVSGRGRHRPGFIYRSRDPYSTEGFELAWTGEMTYPQPHYIPGKGFLRLFTKYTGLRELYISHSEDGITWSEDIKLAGIREPGKERSGHYQTSARSGNTVGTFFNRHVDGGADSRTDVYYIQTVDFGKTWTTVEGEALALPLSEVESPARVIDYASRGLNVYLKDMGFDEDGNPVFLYLTSPGHEPGPPNGPRTFRITRWDGQKWITHDVCRSDHNYDAGSLYLGSTEWRIIAPTGPGPQSYHSGGELEIWSSLDKGATWNRTKAITSSSPYNHNYARRPLNARDPFMAFWADGDPTGLSPSRLYFSDSHGKVLKLPTHIDSDTAKPSHF